MKYIYSIILSLLVFSLSAQQAEETLRSTPVDPFHYSGQLKITVMELSEQGDELFMDIEVRMDRNVMNRRLGYLLIPELRSEDSTVTGTGFLVNGKIRDQLYRRKLSFGNRYLLDNRPHIKTEVKKYADTLIRYTLRMPYEMWMDDAALDIHQILVSPTGKEQLYTLAGASRVALQSREPYAVKPALSALVPEYQPKNLYMQGKAYLDFQVGRSVIVPNFRRNPEELAKIDATIKSVKDNPDAEITSLTIEGYASPEASYTLNERLAHERSQALANYIVQQYGFGTHMMRVTSVPEDWDGLRILVEESDLVRRDEVLAVIDSSDAPDHKEQRLKAMGWPWTAMLNTMFPQLRRVEYQIDFTVKDYTLEESRDLIGRDPAMLSQRELFLLAQTYDAGSEEYQQIFETMIRQSPEDPVAIINYSSVLLAGGELSAAKRYLDRVTGHVEAANNLGVYYLLSDDLDTAEVYLLRAKEAGSEEAAHNLEELDRKRENNILMERYQRQTQNE